jgi:hypothetical protein
MSPTKRTRSVAIAVRFGIVMFEPSRLRSGTMHGIGPSPAFSRSAPVRMPTTPGAARAVRASILTILACGWGERRK